MIDIVKKTSTTNTTSSPGRKIAYIVIHYTAGVSSKPGAASSTASWFANPSAQASADFIVDDATIVQYNPDPKNRYCWAVGGSRYANKGGRLYGIATNANSISIEICSTNATGKMTQPNDSNYTFTDAVLKKAVELTKYLMSVYGIDTDHVIRHYDVNGKPCPGIIGWNVESGSESKWAAFKAQLSSATNPADPVYYRVQIGAYRVKANADTCLAKVKKAGFNDAFIKLINGLYKVQVGAYSFKTNAAAMLERVKKAGFEGFITTESGGTIINETTPTLKSVEVVAKEVIEGKWGNGAARKAALEKAGYNYAEVQKKVNSMLG